MKVLREELGLYVRSVLGRLPEHNSGAAIIALSGELGSGKTTFVQALAKELGISATVQSPTYVLMKKYEMHYKRFTTLVHIDAYRLESPGEFATLKPGQFLNDPACVVVVEWPERLGTLLPPPDARLAFSAEAAGEGERYIEVQY